MIQPSWKAFFIFSNKEIKGIIVLGIILFGSVCIRFFFPSKDIHTIGTNNKSKTIVHLFSFDPNTIDSLQAIQLGIPPKQVNNLLHYRLKGGNFKTKEDFAKLYGLSPTLYASLVPFINISKKESKWNAQKEIGYPYKNGGDPFKNEEVWKIDMNTATEIEWRQKTALSTYLIQRIMGYKQYRGAFTKPSDITKVYGFSDSIYQSLRAHLTVNRRVNYLLNAHSMNFKDWKALGLFTDAQIWTILKLKRSMDGRLQWEVMVTTLDLTQAEANQLKGRVRFNE